MRFPRSTIARAARIHGGAGIHRDRRLKRTAQRDRRELEEQLEEEGMTIRCEKCHFTADKAQELVTIDGETLCLPCWEKYHKDDLYEVTSIGPEDTYYNRRGDHIGLRGTLRTARNSLYGGGGINTWLHIENLPESLRNHVLYAQVFLTRVREVATPRRYRPNTPDPGLPGVPEEGGMSLFSTILIILLIALFLLVAGAAATWCWKRRRDDLIHHNSRNQSHLLRDRIRPWYRSEK